MTSKQWPKTHAPKDNSYLQTEDFFETVNLNDLKQGEIYLVKIRLTTIALFQGWQDETCCFYILRSESLKVSKWCEAKYLPNNFDAYPAFDLGGNPAIHLWSKQLKSIIPPNWFSLFEEAKTMQKHLYGCKMIPVSIRHSAFEDERNKIQSFSEEINDWTVNVKKDAIQRTVVRKMTSGNTAYAGKKEETDSQCEIPKECLVENPTHNNEPKKKSKNMLLEQSSINNAIKANETGAKENYLQSVKNWPPTSQTTQKKVTHRKSWSAFFLKKKKNSSDSL